VLAKFGIGQRVRVKKAVTWLPVPPGSKLTITKAALNGKTYFCEGEGRTYWISPQDLEFDENANAEASESSPSHPSTPSP